MGGHYWEGYSRDPNMDNALHFSHKHGIPLADLLPTPAPGPRMQPPRAVGFGNPEERAAEPAPRDSPVPRAPAIRVPQAVAEAAEGVVGAPNRPHGNDEELANIAHSLGIPDQFFKYYKSRQPAGVPVNLQDFLDASKRWEDSGKPPLGDVGGAGAGAAAGDAGAPYRPGPGEGAAAP